MDSMRRWLADSQNGRHPGRVNAGMRTVAVSCSTSLADLTRRTKSLFEEDRLQAKSVLVKRFREESQISPVSKQVGEVRCS
jgi:hypothetical protein